MHSPLHTPPQQEPMEHRVPFSFGVGLLQTPVAAVQLPGTWHSVALHSTLRHTSPAKGSPEGWHQRSKASAVREGSACGRCMCDMPASGAHVARPADDRDAHAVGIQAGARSRRLPQPTHNGCAGRAPAGLTAIKEHILRMSAVGGSDPGVALCGVRLRPQATGFGFHEGFCGVWCVQEGLRPKSGCAMRSLVHEEGWRAWCIHADLSAGGRLCHLGSLGAGGGWNRL